MKTNILLSVVLFFGLLHVKAQATLDLPFVKDSAEPELFIFDPNYTEDGHIDHYSLGDVIKVKYKYDNQRRPVKKVFYVIDKYDRRLETIMVTDFIYQNNRLVSEQTTQYNGESPVYTLSKNTTYDSESRTDTTRTALEWKNLKYKDRLHVYADEGHTIRYLNQYNLPDSSVYVFDNEDYSYHLKNIYTYKKQQLVGCQTFVRHTDVFNYDWKKVNEYNVVYTKNKVEYTQTTKIPDRFDEDIWEDVVLKYAVSTDKNGRITSRLLSLKNEAIMDGHYTYNEKGQTNVKQKFNLNEEFMRFFGMSVRGFLDGLAEELKNLHYTVTHQDNCKQSVICMGQTKSMEINVCQYPDDKLQSVETIRYDDGELYEQERDEYRYLANGFIEKIKYESYDGGLRPDEKYIYKEDDKGRVLQEEEFAYNNENKQWKAESKKIYKFDEYGYNCYLEAYSYRYNSGWNGERLKEWVFDAQKRVLKEKTQRWENGKWHNYSLEEAAYDEMDRKTLNVAYRWDDKEQCWLGQSKDSTYFDDSRHITGKMKYVWNTRTKTWIPDRKKETERLEGRGEYSLGFKERVISYNWEEDKWQPETMKIEDKKRNASFYSYSKWDAGKQQWNTEEEDLNETDENGTVRIERYSWNETLGELDGIEGTTTTHFNGYDNRRVIYRSWDRANKVWKDTIACNIFEMSNNSAFIYELFDEKSNSWTYNYRIDKIELPGGRMELKQSSWNSKENDWEGDRKILSYYNKEGDPCKFEFYVYDKKKKEWQPLYLEEASKKIHTFYKWNNQQQTWTKYLAKKNERWEEIVYLWDEKKQKFVEMEYYEYRVMESAIRKEMEKIDIKTSYRSVMGR